MMASQAAHREDPSIRGALEEVRRVFMGDEEMPDPDAITLPEGMTPDKFMDLFTRHLGVIESKFEAAVADAERRASDPEQRKDYLMLLLQRGMAAWQAEAFEEVGVDQETFQACLFKFQTDPVSAHARAACKPGLTGSVRRSVCCWPCLSCWWRKSGCFIDCSAGTAPLHVHGNAPPPLSLSFRRNSAPSWRNEWRRARSDSLS
jgi:hypothetical protein